MTTITLKNKPTIKYKRTRNPRPFKVWESEVLTGIAYNATEVKHQIMKLSVEQNKALVDMNHFAVKALDLYALVDNYLIMYNMLLKEGLIQSGTGISPKSLH